MLPFTLRSLGAESHNGAYVVSRAAIGKKAILKPLGLSEQETQDLVTFLESLQDSGGNYRRKAFAEDCR